MESRLSWNDIDHSLREKSKAYAEFLSATLLLREALEAEEMKTVGRLLEKREEVVSRINEQDRLLDLYRRALPPDVVSALSTRLSGITEDLGRTLKKIIAANQDCNIIAASRRDTIKKELQMIRQEEKGHQGYAPKMKRTPQFLNIET